MVDSERVGVVLPVGTHLRVAYCRSQLVTDVGFIGGPVCCGKRDDELTGIVICTSIRGAGSACCIQAANPVVAARGHRNPCACAFIPDPKCSRCRIKVLVYLSVGRLDRNRRISSRVVEVRQRFDESDRCIVNCDSLSICLLLLCNPASLECLLRNGGSAP